MATAFAAFPGEPRLPDNRGRHGPATRAALARTLAFYLGLCLVGALPLLLGWSGPWQAAGIGLWWPGAGFLASGGWSLLLLPLTLLLFAAAVFLWFGAGMTIAPPLVWLGAAMLAGAVSGETAWPGAPLVAALVLAGLGLWTLRRRAASVAAGLAVHALRSAALPEAFAAAKARAVPAPPPEAREMDAEQIAALRYALERALQPLDAWNGFDRHDEFQTAARRYQINYLGYALAYAQHNFAPSFHGYLAEAQRSLIERYLQPEIW